MTPQPDAAAARAYLLGLDREHDRDLIEQEYFRSAEALELVETAEDTLIEDYLTGRLSPRERATFEQHYLASPLHQVRMETLRLLGEASRPASVSPDAARAVALQRRVRWLAVAAGLVVAVGAGVWLATRSAYSDRGRLATSGAPGPVTAAPTNGSGPLVAFPWALSPATVRGSSDTPALVIPVGTDVVDLQLEADGTAATVAHGRVVIRTVGGAEVWQGSVAARSTEPARVAAISEVPAARLRADDYLITLFEVGTSGTEVERSRYFLRVRAR
jgi:hypothetical protein